MIPCTLWFLYIQEDRLKLDPWDFNHLEDGHSRATTPAPKHPSHEHWKKAWWHRVHAWLTDAITPVVVYYSPEEAST